MSLAVGRSQRYLRLSVQELIGSSVTTAAGVVIPVFYPGPYGLADPGAVADDDSAAVTRIEISWFGRGAGKKGSTFMQADIYQLAGSDGLTDPYGFEAEDIMDALASVFSGLKADGSQRGYIDLYDYAVPATPVPLGVCALCQNSRGDLGELDSSVELTDLETGMRHLTGRWRFRTLTDVSGPAAFYTG